MTQLTKSAKSIKIVGVTVWSGLIKVVVVVKASKSVHLSERGDEPRGGGREHHTRQETGPL